MSIKTIKGLYNPKPVTRIRLASSYVDIRANDAITKIIKEGKTQGLSKAQIIKNIRKSNPYPKSSPYAKKSPYRIWQKEIEKRIERFKSRVFVIKNPCNGRFV